MTAADLERLVWAPAYQMYVFESDRTPCPWECVVGNFTDAVKGELRGIRPEPSAKEGEPTT